MSNPSRKEFRSPRWLAAIPLAAAVFCCVFAVELYLRQGLTLSCFGASCFVLLLLVGSLELFLSRVTLTDQSLEIFSNFRLRAYPRGSFTSVSWAKSCPISLSTTRGGFRGAAGFSRWPRDCEHHTCLACRAQQGAADNVAETAWRLTTPSSVGPLNTDPDSCLRGEL